MPFDFKKEERTLYQPPRTPGILTVPPMNFLAVRGGETQTKRAGRINRPSSCCTVLLLH